MLLGSQFPMGRAYPVRRTARLCESRFLRQKPARARIFLAGTWLATCGAMSEERLPPNPRRGPSVLLDEAATLLGVSRRTVYYRIREGKLRTIRTRGGSQRALLESIEALLRAPIAGRRTAGVGAVGPRSQGSQSEALPFQV
jgi:excisionase family DNA binding protein